MNSITPFQSPRPSKKALRFLTRAGSVPENVPDMSKRNTLNLLLVGASSLPVGALAVPYALFFVPKSAGGGGAARWRRMLLEAISELLSGSRVIVLVIAPF